MILADTLRRQRLGLKPLSYRAWQRICVEPLFNLLGLAFGQFMVSLPWRIRRHLDSWIIQQMGGHPVSTKPPLEPRTVETVEAAKYLYRTTGRWPATLILTSHPPTAGPLEWLRFELLRQGLGLANAIVETSPHRFSPQCLLAIDPFALDTIPVPAAGFYAGWMHRIYLAWDRQSRTQGGIQRHILLRHTDYGKIFHRLLQRLKGDIPVVMVLSGGLPHNARLLYTAREFVQQLSLLRWPYPKRQAEIKFLDILMKLVGDIYPPEKGELPPRTEADVQKFLIELGVDAIRREALIEEFKIEFRRPVPYRTRLFRFLLNRVLRQGKPLLLIAVAHAETQPPVHVSEPWGVFRDAQGRLQRVEGPDFQPQPLTDITRFAQEFNRAFTFSSEFC